MDNELNELRMTFSRQVKINQQLRMDYANLAGEKANLQVAFDEMRERAIWLEQELAKYKDTEEKDDNNGEQNN
ncbi:hypothetical protein BKM15_25985 [Pseudomonas syringae pv. syringae]|nr:hypothetical protein BKM15_25985 [Pseudomonas syringae pv. syringae]